MKGKYEVGYGKPPKASRFGNRPQPDRSSKSEPANETAIDLSAAINGLIPVTHNGKATRMHPHEAAMHGLVKNALRGNLRAIKEILSECKKAGLLEAPPAQLTSGAIFAPKGVPVELAARLVRIVGPPPWDNEVFEIFWSEYERDCENIERLAEKARQDEKTE